MAESTLDLLRPNLACSDYERIIKRFYGFIQPWERLNRELILAAIPSFSPRFERSEWLQQDLRSLAVNPEHLPLYKEAAPARNLAAALGAMYVIEGSTLGGQFIIRHLAGTPGIPPQATRYFSGYGPRTGEMWQTFRAEAAQHVAAGEHDQTVYAAKETFRSICQWFGEADR